MTFRAEIERIMADVETKPDGTYHYPGGIQVIKASGRVDVTDEAARAFLVHPGELFELITCNLFAENINDKNERMECAQMISNLIEERLAKRLSTNS